MKCEKCNSFNVGLCVHGRYCDKINTNIRDQILVHSLSLGLEYLKKTTNLVQVQSKDIMIKNEIILNSTSVSHFRIQKGC